VSGSTTTPPQPGTSPATTPGVLPTLGTVERPFPESPQIVAYLSTATGSARANPINTSGYFPGVPEGIFAVMKDDREESTFFNRTTETEGQGLPNGDHDNSNTIETYSSYRASSYEYRVKTPVLWPETKSVEADDFETKIGSHSTE
jgi:hypothetical protein